MLYTAAHGPPHGTTVSRRPRGQPAPPTRSCRAEKTAPRGESTPVSCGRSRTTRSARRWRCRRTSGCGSRRTASSAEPRGTWTSSTSSASRAPSRRAAHDRVPQRRGRSRGRVLRHARRGSARAFAHDLRRRLRLSARRRRGRHAQAHDPLTEHGALPRRAPPSIRRCTRTSTPSGPT